jgi:hypothetical protein
MSAKIDKCRWDREKKELKKAFDELNNFKKAYYECTGDLSSQKEFTKWAYKAVKFFALPKTIGKIDIGKLEINLIIINACRKEKYPGKRIKKIIKDLTGYFISGAVKDILIKKFGKRFYALIPGLISALGTSLYVERGLYRHKKNLEFSIKKRKDEIEKLKRKARASKKSGIACGKCGRKYKNEAGCIKECMGCGGFYCSGCFNPEIERQELAEKK